ncbi:hypothetical protein R1sor_001103 [Riccia sorocarpa]|uniref:ATP-binding cassette transporter n=1 Tax=Riccia sorocarpa TaxID=122646 RepID=A0ABD3GZ73_9MARC
MESDTGSKEAEGSTTRRVSLDPGVNLMGSNGMKRSQSDADAEEAKYFAQKLQDWYDRNSSVNGYHEPSPAVPPPWLQKEGAASMDEKGKSPVSDVVSVSEGQNMKETLPTLSKDELVGLVMSFYNELVVTGHTADANKLLRSILHKDDAGKPAETKTAETGIDKLLNEGLLSFLLKINKQLPPLPAQVIKFKDVSYHTHLPDAKEGYDTVGSVCLKLFLPCLSAGKVPSKFPILQDCTGYLMPGTLTLVCGPPGCGKTSLHKLIAGRLRACKKTFLSGSVTYNGKGLHEFQPRRAAAYIAQTDRHLPTLTVKETVAFAYECTSLYRQENYKNGKVSKVAKELGGENLPLELTLHLLGLRAVADTPVGSATVRGVSGGERHRVTTAEMVVGSYSVLLLDEISTGLDSSATFDIVSTLRTIARVRQTTCLLSLLQPSPEVFDMFDRVIVLSEGYIIYQGPKDDIIPYFAELGYTKPKHVDVADFLQEITTPDGIHFIEPGFRPLNTEEFHAAYLKSDMYTDVLRVVNNPKVVQEIWVQSEKPLGLKLHDQFAARAGDKNLVEVFEVEPTGTVATADIQQTSRVKAGDVITAVVGSHGKLEYISGTTQEFVAEDVVQKVMEAQGTVRLQLERVLDEGKITKTAFVDEYVQDWKSSAKTVLFRQSKLAIRNKVFVIARNIQVLIIGIFTGTLFYRVSDSHDQSAMDLKKSLAFLACMALSLNTVSQIPAQLDERQVFEKHFSARFFRTRSYVLASAMSGIPYLLMETLIYCPLLYWLTGLSGANHGRHFVLYMLIVFMSGLSGGALVRLIVSVSGTREGATGLAGLSIVIFLLFAGFLITVNKVPHWWIWAYYVSPLQWGVTSLICNEFLSGKYDMVKLPTAARLLAAKKLAMKESGKMPEEPQAPATNAQVGGESETAAIPVVETSTIGQFVPTILSFHKITYEVDVPGAHDPRQLLTGVSGFARPGTLTALMGSSGAGKTTLLDVLAGRKTVGRITGEILINGYPKVPETFARISGYVEQNDIHTPFITVKESLEFSANLRLPPTANRSQFVKEVMDVLELEGVGNKLVGVIGDSGISVEEAKRLTIGVELVANPSILFLDEPTSGLDSRAAQVVMRSITGIVNTGRTVICTIHQPSRRLFLSFGHLLLLKRGGRAVYFGPIGKDAEDLLAYFHALPGVQECGQNQNPASYMLEIIGAGIGHSAERDFAMDYSKSALNQVNAEVLESFRFGKGKLGPQPTVKGYAATVWLMFLTVTKRQYKTYWRNIAYSFGRMMLSVILGLLLGSAFWQIKYDNTPGMASRLGLIYLSIVFVAITNANNVIPQVNAERPVYYRERASNMYSLLLYNLSWTLAEIPYLCISTLTFCGICFPMAGVATESATQFFQYWFVFFEYAASITFFGIFMAMMTPNAETATVIIPLIINFWNMTSGFMIPKNSIPNFWIWLYWINPTTFALNSLNSIAFYCDTTHPPCNTCTPEPKSCVECECVRMADQNNLVAWTVLSLGRSLDYTLRARDMWVLFIFIVGFCILGVFALRFMRFDKR